MPCSRCLRCEALRESWEFDANDKSVCKPCKKYLTYMNKGNKNKPKVRDECLALINRILACL